MPKTQEITLTELMKRAMKNKKFATKLNNDPMGALKNANLCLNPNDERKLRALKLMSDRLTADMESLSALLATTGFVAGGGEGPPPINVKPPWPWPAEWVDPDVRMPNKKGGTPGKKTSAGGRKKSGKRTG